VRNFKVLDEILISNKAWEPQVHFPTGFMKKEEQREGITIAILWTSNLNSSPYNPTLLV
jgi:hypothetical protein